MFKQIVTTLSIGTMMSTVACGFNLWHHRRVANKNICDVTNMIGFHNIDNEVDQWDRDIWQKNEIIKQQYWLNRPFYQQIMNPPPQIVSYSILKTLDKGKY